MKQAQVITLSLLAAATACGGLSVSTDWDQSYDFGSVQTFAVLDEAGDDALDDLNDARVKSAITSVMESKGYRAVSDASQADVAVGYQFTADQRTSYQTVNSGWGGYGYGGYGGWYGPGMGMSTSTTTERQYEVGSLLIAVFDTSERKMVFTSDGSQTLSSGQQSPEQLEEEINSAVSEILEGFPPGS